MYEGITVEYVGGKEPILTIHKEGAEEGEVVNLRPYNTEELLRKLFEREGFVLKPKEERERLRRKAIEDLKLEKERKELRLIRTRYYYDKEKHAVTSFLNDVMGGIPEDKDDNAVKGGRQWTFFLNENYRRMYADEYFEYTGNRIRSVA